MSPSQGNKIRFRVGGEHISVLTSREKTNQCWGVAADLQVILFTWQLCLIWQLPWEAWMIAAVRNHSVARLSQRCMAAFWGQYFGWIRGHVCSGRKIIQWAVMIHHLFCGFLFLRKMTFLFACEHACMRVYVRACVWLLVVVFCFF